MNNNDCTDASLYATMLTRINTVSCSCANNIIGMNTSLNFKLDVAVNVLIIEYVLFFETSMALY